MKPAGAIYRGEFEDYLAVYRFNRDVHIKLPDNLTGKRVGHIAYSVGKKGGGVDIFPIEKGQDVSEKINVKKIITFNDEQVIVRNLDDRSNKKFSNADLEQVIKSQDVEGEILNSDRFNQIINPVLADIEYFCNGKIASTKNSQIISSVEVLGAKTKLETTNRGKWLSGGKSEFIKQCKLEANIDFADGCLASFVPGEKASFDGKIFSNYFHLVGGDCDYCYASPKHKSFPKSIFKFDEAKILDELQGNCKLIYDSEETLGKPVGVLRFGKRTESWTPFTENSFVKTLELMTQTGTRGVIPTKFLPYDNQISDLVKKTNSTLIYSVGNDEWETGAVAHGATNQFRIEEAIKYKKSGASVMFYLALPAPFLPPQENEKKILRIAYKNNIQVQLLPMRHGTKDFAYRATGESWNSLKDSSLALDLFSGINHGAGAYKFQKGNGLLPIKYHSDWMKMVGDNRGMIKMCHHDDKKVYCGTCSYKPGFIVDNNN